MPDVIVVRGASTLLRLVLAVALLGACTAAPSDVPGADGRYAAIEGAQLLVRGERNLRPDVDREGLKALARANAGFAFDLYRAVAAGNSDNVLLGPHSISSALAMVYVGARGETAQEMADVLHFAGLPLEVAPGFNALDLALASRTQPGVVELRIVNQGFAAPGLNLLDAYLTTLSRDFGAPMAEVDFTDTNAAEEVINRWAAQRTNGRVTELFPPGALTPQTVLVVANAVSLDAQWRYLFEAAQTRPATFELPSGEIVTVPAMHFDYYLPLVWEEDFSAVELPYGQGDLSMVLLLPQDLEAFEAELDPDRLQSIVDDITEQGIHLSLPKFAFKRHTDLDEALQGLGMRMVYGHADLSGVTGGTGLYLETVQHEAFIEVDEQGTEAHAATAAGMPVSHGPTISFDRPFMFVIRDRVTGAVLFIGRVTDPRG